MKFRLPLAALFTTLVAGCASTPPYNPFKIPEEELRAKIKTIALTPVAIPGDIENTDTVRTQFETQIAAKLRDAGFLVVPSKESTEIFATMNKQLGGIYDPLTGKRDEAKYKAAREHALRELATKHNADAVLYSGIRFVAAGFAGGVARWGGTSESIALTEGFLSALQVNQLRGTARALSIVISIESTNGGEAYVNGGGIQLASKLSGGRFVTVPRDQLFASEERGAAAVTTALAPLIAKAPSTGAVKPSP